MEIGKTAKAIFQENEECECFLCVSIIVCYRRMWVAHDQLVKDTTSNKSSNYEKLALMVVMTILRHWIKGSVPYGKNK